MKRKWSYESARNQHHRGRTPSARRQAARPRRDDAGALRNLPDVPTIAESGFPGFDAGNWFGVVVRSGTPSSIVDRLNAEIVRVLELPAVREPLVSHGLSPAPMTSEQFTAFIHSEMERNGKIVKSLNLKID
ncbi:MAG: Bug family tripartite tricarboxylate transporter substrate binding protein [Burkholderiales bacterium]